MVQEQKITDAFVVLADCGNPLLRQAVEQALTGGRALSGSEDRDTWVPSWGFDVMADAVASDPTGYVSLITEVKRGDHRGTPAGAQRVNLRAMLKHGPNLTDHQAVTYFERLRQQAAALFPDAHQWHLDEDCERLGCYGWEHEGTRSASGEAQKLRVGIAQPPAYLFTRWLRGPYWTDEHTVLVVLGGSGADALAYWDSDEDTFGEALGRVVMTTFPMFLTRLAANLTALSLTSVEERLVRRLATLMWLDTDTWEEAAAFAGSAHELVFPVALDALPPWVPPMREACPCQQCQARRGGPSPRTSVGAITT